MATKKNQPKNQRGKAASKAALAAVAGAVALSSEANAAEASLDQLTNIESLNNVTSLRRLDDGRLEVTLETGEIIILGEDDFVEQAGQFLIDAEALAANGGVTNIALLALGAGAIVGGVIAATGGDDDDDVDPELVLNVPSEAADSLVGTPGVDTIDGLGGDDSIDGLGGDDTLIGNAGNDTLIGGEGSDTLLGGTGSDTLTGNAGFDTLDGGAGSDALSGGAGDDTLVVDLADTLIDGGDGSDTLDLSTLDSGVRVDLDVDTPNPGPASQIGVIGQPDDGIEILDLENVIGTDFDDTILGNNEINNLQGGAGNDAIHSFAGVDTIDGGEGIDTALFSAGAGVIVDLDETGSGQAFVNVDGEAGAESDFFFNFENVNGSNNIGSANGGNDILSGNSGVNVLNGQAGDDILDGEGGADTLIGGDGNDTLIADLEDVLIDGGEGVDTLDLSALTDGVRVDLDVNTPNPGPASQDGVIGQPEDGIALVDVENIIGSQGDDVLLGNNEINVIEGGAGNDSIHSFAGVDTIDGGEGIDTALFSAGPGVIVTLNEEGSGQAFVNVDGEAGAESDFFFNFENVNGSNNTGSANGGNDILTGNSQDNVLNGQAGDDILNGEGGADTLIGGDGDDLIISDALDTVDGGEGNDTIDFSGVTQSDPAIFGPFDGVIVDLDVNSAGPAGEQSQNGGILNAPPGAVAVDGVVPADNILQEIDNVENVIGSDFNDGLFGNNEVNILSAGAGNDSVHGFAGDDFLAGGEGTDTVLFVAAPDDITVDLTAQVSQEDFDAAFEAGTLDELETATTGPAGENVLSGFENVTAGVGNDTLIGNDADNVLNGNVGDDFLVGGLGNDTLIGGRL